MIIKRENLAARLRTSLVALSASLFVVLALPVLFQDSYHAVHAQDIEKEFAENGTGPVVTFNVEDPEGGGLVWSLSGDDGDHFSIDDGVLSPNPPKGWELEVP